jgi:hypothetical protein
MSKMHTVLLMGHNLFIGLHFTFSYHLNSRIGAIMTNLEIIINTLENHFPVSQMTGEEAKDIIVQHLKQYGLEKEREALVNAFIEGQSKPHASFQAWADRKFNQVKTKTDDSE